MAGDLRSPLGNVKGYQFWALLGVIVAFGTRVLMAQGIPLGPFGITFVENDGVAIILTDVLGVLIAFHAFTTYQDFVNRAKA